MNTHSHHAIRLAGPWTISLAVLDPAAILLRQTSELRINLTKPDPESWQIWFHEQALTLDVDSKADERIQSIFKRRFNRPTGLAVDQRLSIHVEFMDPYYCREAIVQVNNQTVSGIVQNDLEYVAELKSLEEGSSLLELSLPVLAANAGANVQIPPFKSAQLVISG